MMRPQMLLGHSTASRHATGHPAPLLRQQCDAGARGHRIVLLSFLNPVPQNPAPATQGAFDIQPGCSFLNDLQWDPRIGLAEFFGMCIRCTEETSAVIRIIMALDLHHRYWCCVLVGWRP